MCNCNINNKNKLTVPCGSNRCLFLTTSTTSSSTTTFTSTCPPTTTTTTTTTASPLFILLHFENNTGIDNILFSFKTDSITVFSLYLNNGQSIDQNLYINKGSTISVNAEYSSNFNAQSSIEYDSVGPTLQNWTSVLDIPITIGVAPNNLTFLDFILNSYNPPTTTTTSTSTTTTTSSTTTTTTTTVPDPLEIRVINNAPMSIGFNTVAWYNTAPFNMYYAPQGGALLSGQTQVTYNSVFGNSNQTTLRYENTSAIGVSVSMYFSDDNGSSYSLLGTSNLVGHTTLPYPATQQTFTTTPNNTGVKNIIEFRVDEGEYSLSNYIIRVVNNTGYTVNMAQLRGRTSPSNVNYFTSNNPTINNGVTTQYYSGALKEAATRITITNAASAEPFNVSFYYSNNNGGSYSLLGSGFVSIGGSLDSSISTPSPGNGVQCILEIRLS